jgi:hypothetical protein
LQKLNLSYNRINDVSALEGLTELTELDLTGNDGIEAEQLQRLMYVLPKCKIIFISFEMERKIESLPPLTTIRGEIYSIDLTELDLSASELVDSDLESLAETLKEMVNLSILNLSGNQLNLKRIMDFKSKLFIILPDCKVILDSAIQNEIDNLISSEVDTLLAVAIEAVIEAGEAKTSSLQRALKIGYGRAARLLDIMEERGVVSKFNESNLREVLMTRQEYENNTELMELKAEYQAEKAEQEKRNQEYLEEQAKIEVRRKFLSLPPTRPSDFTYGQYPGDEWCAVCHKNAPTSLFYEIKINICMECYNYLRESVALFNPEVPRDSYDAKQIVDRVKGHERIANDFKDVAKIATGVAFGNKISDFFGGKK